MNFLKYFFLLVSLLSGAAGFAQKGNPMSASNPSVIRQITLEPGIGVHTNFGVDLLLTNLLQWNPRKRLSLAAHSSFNLNNTTQRYFNGIRTDYNYSINQKFGVGTSLYGRKWSHTFLLMAGVKYTRYQEILDDDRFDRVRVAISAFSPDYGLLYSLKKGWKNCFFTSRLYVPLYPWPTKGASIQYADGNLDAIALEFGMGIKLK